VNKHIGAFTEAALNTDNAGGRAGQGVNAGAKMYQLAGANLHQ